VPYIELHGNRYGPDLGYQTAGVLAIVGDAGLAVSGICGIATSDAEFASNRPHVRQRAIDYFRRQADFCKEVGGAYVLIVPGAVGRPKPHDQNEFGRAVEGIRIVAEHFDQLGVKGAIEPIRPEEVSLCHTFADARRLIEAVDHPGVAHINGDTYHMLAGETHIGEAILGAGTLLANLQMADTNRRALGAGLLDVDVVLMALYAIGYERRDGYCTPEPLGAGGNPYAAMYEVSDPAVLDAVVAQTAATFHEREASILAATDEELLERFPAAR
jgi:sugar phosphate isomerase/epimerase